MAKKPTINTVSSGYASSSIINQNMESLRDGFDNTLSLDGSAPNAMGADIDLNGNNIINGADGSFTSLTLNGETFTAIGASVFTELDDVPQTYAGAGSQFVRVNSGATGLEFVSGILFSTTEQSKLDGIEPNATQDQTGAEIKALYEAEADTNAFTDALATKLAGIEEGATSDQTGAEITATLDTYFGGSSWQGAGDMVTSNNLSDLVDPVAALVNLGLTATAAEINTLDGITATVAELNILDGVTSTAAELNILDGVTATATELNYVAGVTSAIQTQLDAKAAASAVLMTQTEITGTTYTTLEADFAGNVIRRMNDGTGVTITVAAGLSNQEPATFIQTGAGQITFAPDTGVTINSADGKLKTRVQFSSATLIPDVTTANTYYLVGDITT